MPSSAPYALPVIAGIARQVRPSSVLDIGVGFGKYGCLFREYLDIWDMQSVSDYERSRWKTRIEGIEATPEYLTPLHDYIYDRIHLGDVNEVIDTLGAYDVVVMGDVLEHFPKPAGAALLDKLFAHTAKCLLLTFPPDCAENHNVLGNPYESHRSSWNRKDFRRFDRVGYRVFEGRVALVVIAKPPHELPLLTPYFGARRRTGGWQGLAMNLLVGTLGPSRAARLSTRLTGARPVRQPISRLHATRPKTHTRDAASGGARAEPSWERVWRHEPSDAEDDLRLTREAQGRRWGLVVEQLEGAFGSLRGLRTIELGSGRGDLSALLAQRGAQVTLIDQSKAALEQAKRRFNRLGLNARYECADILGPLDTWRDRADVALSLGVVQHFRGDQRTAALKAHRDVLRPGGLAIVGVPHAWCVPYRWWKLYLELRGWWPYGLEIPYSRREIAARARAVGFDQTETRCLGFWQSVGDHWGKLLTGCQPSWVDRPSWLDGLMGAMLLLFARRRRA